MMRSVIAALGLLICLLFGGDARAADPVTFRWDTRNLFEHQDEWNATRLIDEGYGHFVVNGTALPTYTVPGMYKAVPFKYLDRLWVSAAFNRFEAVLRSPHGIMRVGPNVIHFTYGRILDHAGYTHDDISAHGVFGHPTMFRLSAGGPGGRKGIYRWYGFDDGSAATPGGAIDGDQMAPSAVNYTISLNLEQLAPQLAADIKNFEATLQRDQDNLVANASQIANLATQLENLKKLQEELAELLKLDLGDELARALDDLLARYTEIPKDTRDALVKIVNDLHSNIAQMQAELSRITSDFRNQTDQIVDLVERPTVADGWNPNDLSNYVSTIDPHDIPGVVVPDTQSGPFDSAHDPYAAYADQIIAKLGQYVQDDSVVARKDFLGIVRGWRKNQTALEDALRARGYPVKETSAFNAARNRVTDHLRRYIDGKDWFIDNPVPQETRDAIDRVIARQFVELAPRLKEAMNEWRGKSLVGNQALAIETVNGIASGVDDLDPADFDTRAHVRSALEGITSGILGGVRLGIGFAPVVGDAMDICEAITGYEFCTSTGRKMSKGEQICSGLGAIVGSGKFWRAVGHGVGASAAVLMASIANAADHLSDLPRAEREALVKRLGTLIYHFDGINGTEIKRLLDKFGDATARLLTPGVKAKGLQELETLQFMTSRLSGNVGKFHMSVKDAAAVRGAAVKALPPLKGKTLAEIRNILQQGSFVKDAASTASQEFWTYKTATGGDGSVVRIALTGTSARPKPHLKKEISFTLGFSDEEIACKLTDAAVPVPQGTKEARSILSGWFEKLSGDAPDKGELELLLNLWGEYTHIDFIP